uniref:Uncharacterized protein n=1 Tax=Spongospora subterranea TaxID=70186 RepID=A0A0H5REF6_9EUKA|eukprot:CRZ06954.1 hypothetical protein [Spongospora subterranea]
MPIERISSRSQPYSLIDGKLAATRASQLRAMTDLERESDRVKAASDAIELEARQYTQEIIDRLQVETRRKTALLRVFSHNIQATVEEIETFSRTILEKRQSAKELHNFVQSFDSLLRLGNSLAQRQTPEKITVTTDDLPKEIEGQKRIVKRYGALDDLISVKDAMIWYLLQERNYDGSKEAENWAALTDKYAEALEQFRMECSHCLVPLSPTSVNTHCLETGNKRHQFINAKNAIA